MALECPACGGSTHHFVACLELEPNGSSDERQLQVLRCGGCQARFGAFYEESRRGALSSELTSYDVIATADEDVRGLETLMTACPNQRSAACQCDVHRAFAEHSDFHAVLAARRPAPPQFPPHSLSETARLVGAVVMIWLLTWWGVHNGDWPRGLYLLFAPAATTNVLWMLTLPPQAVRHHPWANRVSLALGFACGAYLAVRFG